MLTWHTGLWKPALNSFTCCIIKPGVQEGRHSKFAARARDACDRNDADVALVTQVSAPVKRQMFAPLPHRAVPRHSRDPVPPWHAYKG